MVYRSGGGRGGAREEHFEVSVLPFFQDPAIEVAGQGSRAALHLR